jgi:hypothetical protein
MAKIEIARLARDDLNELIATRNLPANTEERVWRSLRVLEIFPLGGHTIGGRWADARFVLGPWRWMILLYRYEESSERVYVVAVHDARSSSSVTSAGDS